MAFPIDTPAEMIGQLYVGYFGRAADPDGLNYWINQLNGGMSLQAIANSFAVQPEATALYSYLAAPEVGDPAAFVTAIYQDLFNRGPDAGGLAYWVNQLVVQGTQPGQMVLSIISGAVGADKTSVENKTHVAVDYAQKFVDNNLTWIGIDNIQGARDVVIPVTSDPATVVAAILQIDGIITQELTNPQNIQLTPNLSTIQSGGTVAITLKADPSQANKDFQYTITGVDSSVVKGGTLSGTVKLGSDSTAVINVGTVVTAAQLDTPNETIKVTVGPISTNVGLTEGTQVVTQTGPVNEGNSFNFTVTTSGIAAGSANGLVQTYTISGPGLAHIPVGERSGTVTLDNNGVATVTVHTLASLADSGTTQVTITVGNDAPVNVVINETAVQQITPSSAVIQEGAQVIFKVTTTGVAGSAVAGQVENWTLTGAGASQINGPLSGTVTLDQDGTATVTVSTLVNGLNDLSPANLVFTLLSGAVPVGTATVGISQGSQVTTNTGPVNEGSAFSFTVTTTGVAPGSVEGRIESYTLTGPGLSHIPVAERSGTVVLDANGTATVTVHTLTDLTGAGTSTVSIQVGNNAVSTVTINETAVQTVTPNAATILEGGAVVLTINTSGVAGGSVAGQVQTWTLSGAASDQISGPLSGSVTLDSNGSATVTVQTFADALNDLSPQDLVFTLKSGSSQTAQGSVNVSQGSQVTTNTGPVNEGSAFSFTVTTTGVAPGSVAGRQENYTITGPGIDHIPVAARSGIVTLDAAGNATVTVNTLADLAGAGTSTVTIQVGNNAASTVTINETAVQNISVSAGTILEGGSVVFTINTVGVLGSSVAGQVETWTLSGAAASQVDGPLSGMVTLDSNGSATVTVATRVDGLNDGLPKELVFSLSSGATQTAQTAVSVSQGTQVTTAPASVIEGNAFTFEVTTTGVAPGSAAGRIEAYTISGPGLAQIPAAERSGTVVLDANGYASVTVHTLVDLGVLGFKPIVIQVGNNAAVTLDLLDQAFQTVTVSPASAEINQGQSLTFTISTLGVSGSAVAGTVQSWTLSGSGTNQVTGGVLSGTVTLDANGSAVVTVGTDFSIINGPLTQNLRFALDSGGSAVLSPIVTIHESTLTVTPPALPVVEGHQVTFTLTGVNIPSGTTFTYTLSGEAIGNVVPASQGHGTVTINNNTATVVVNTLSNDPSGLVKGLTLTVDQVPTAKGTAQISETAPSSFILTTGTDNFTGNPAGDNTFFAVASSNIFTTSSTLGQNDNLNGNSQVAGHPNTLFLQSTGLFPQLVNAFTTTDIQVLNVNPGQAGAGTTIDMSSVFGMTKLINSNASGKLTLLNVTQAADVELQAPSDVLGGTVDMAVQYQNNPAKPATQTLLLDPTVSPITGLPNSRFWVNVDKVAITSTGPGTNGLITVNGATNGFGATALTNLTLLGSTSFVAGTAGSGQAALAFSGAASAAGTNVLDLSSFSGTFFDVGDMATPLPVITAVGGLTIHSGAGGINGVYAPAPGFTGATQFGGFLQVGGDLTLTMGDGNVVNQSFEANGDLNVLGKPFDKAAGGLLDSFMITAGGYQSYQGFNGGLSGTIITNDGLLFIGTTGLVNGAIDLLVSTGIGQALIFGGNGNVRLDFSMPGSTGFHKALGGPGTENAFIGGTALNTLIIDPMITNVNGTISANGTGLATLVQVITLQSPAGTEWLGTEGGTPGVLPTNTVDLGLLNQNSTFTGVNTAFPQTINIDVALGGNSGSGSGQTFKDAVSGDVFILDNSKRFIPGGSMQGQAMAFDFALPTASNTLTFIANSVNYQAGGASLEFRDFESSTTAPGSQNPITTLNLQLNRTTAYIQNIPTTTLTDLGRLTTLDLSGTANRFNDGVAVLPWVVAGTGGARTLTTITGADQNYSLSGLRFTYMSAIGGTITLGNGANTVGAQAGNWVIASGLAPGGGTAGDSGNNSIILNPQLGNLHTVKTGGGADKFDIGSDPLPGGGRVDIASGAGNDLFLWNQAGVFPALNSAQKVDGGTGRDTFELVAGALNENDSLFGQITNVEVLRMAGGTFNNSLLLNFFANQSGLDTIVTRGADSSNVFFEGTGFTNRMRYEIATQFNASGDTGRDAIIVQALPSGSNAITVATTSTGFNIAFEQGLMTKAINPGTGLVTKSGIFANPNARNTLELTADNATANIFQLGGFGVHDVQTVLGKSGGASVGQTIWLVNDPALGTRTTTIDLHEVQGSTTVYGNGSSLGLTIQGGSSGTNTLQGGSVADTIGAHGTAVGFGTNFIWGGGGADALTGAQGGAGNDVGTVFYIDAQLESPGGPFPPIVGDVHITNFHVDTDTLLINPGTLLLGDIPVFLGDALDYGSALALLSGGGAPQTQAVYQLDTRAMWIDSNNDGLLNQLDIRVFIDFASPGFNPGSVNFGNLLGLFTGAQARAYIDGRVDPASNLAFSGTLLPGEFLFGGGPGFNDKLTLDGGNIADGILVGFEQLEFTADTVGTLSVRQWNRFNLVPNAITGPGINTARFLDGQGPISGGMITVAAIENYDFSGLSDGILMSTLAYFDRGGPQGAGTVLGTGFADTFNVNENDLKAGFTIDGNGGTDTLNVDVTLVFGGTFGASGVAGVTNAQVTNVEVLNIEGGPLNSVGFNPGTAFNVVNGSNGDDVITDPENLAGNWTLNLGFSILRDIVRINASSADISLGAVHAFGPVGLRINAAGASNTRMNFQEYQEFNAGGIALTSGSTFANTTITFSDAVTGGEVLNAKVGNWVLSAANDTFEVSADNGAQKQNVNVAAGGTDTVIFGTGTFSGAYTGASYFDTTIRFIGNADISGATGLGVGNVDFSNASVSVKVNFLSQYQFFAQPFLNTGNVQTIAFSSGLIGLAFGDAGIENYVLASGDDQFAVAADNPGLVGGAQNTDFSSGGNDLIAYYAGKYSGQIVGMGAGDRVVFASGAVDIAGVNGGAATGATIVLFNISNVTATMTMAQYLGFTQPFALTFNSTQTIILTTSGVATGDAGIENYKLGAGDDTFTVAVDNVGLTGGKQNVDVGAGGNDTLVFAAGNFTGAYTGLAAGDTIKFIGDANISGATSPTGAGKVDFDDANISVTMTAQQHQGFKHPFNKAANTQTITLTTSAVQILNDNRIENYVFAGGGDSFYVSADNGDLAGGKQNIDISSGGADFVLYTPGTFTGSLVGAGADDSVVFLAGPADIKGVNGGAATGAKTAIFNNTSSSVTMTAAQHNGFNAPFNTTGGTQTIRLTTSGFITGDAGIEDYVLSASGANTFTVAKDDGAFKQNVAMGANIAALVFGEGTFSGNVTRSIGSFGPVTFTGGTTDISAVSGGIKLGAVANFNDTDSKVSMTITQHNNFAGYDATAGVQTIVLTTSGVSFTVAGIENYVLAAGDDLFSIFAASPTVHVDIGSGGNDTISYDSGTHASTLVGGDVDDTVLLVTSGIDISGVNGGAALGPKTLSFADQIASVAMTLIQHNAFGVPFQGAASSQSIALTTNGVATGDVGIEQYVLGEDGTGPNTFTMGIITQSVQGRSANDTVINPFGGTSGILLGGSNTATGDTLILQAANTVLAAGSGEFENLIFAAAGSSTLKMDNAAHSGFTGVINAQGTNDTIILTTAINGAGLLGIENYQLISSTGTNFFSFTNSQTGTVSGADNRADNFFATASQIANVSLLYGGAGTNTGFLSISTDAAGLDLSSKTKNINAIQLEAGASANVIGVNNFGGNQVSVTAFADTIYTMGFGGFQSYQGALGRDDVTFTMASGAYQLGPSDDILRSKVGGAITAFLVDGGDGVDTFELSVGDDISGIPQFMNFEDLALANNASVRMTGAQYNQFTTNSQAPGANTINIEATGGVSLTTSTFAKVESYVLNGNADDHGYTIAGSNQTITDNDTSGTTIATVAGGLTDMTLTATAGASYSVSDKGGGANHTYVFGDGRDQIEFGGGHTGVSVNLGSNLNSVFVTGGLSGALHGVDNAGTADQLLLRDTADLTGLTVSGYEELFVAGGATVTLSSAIWDQFVGTDGKALFAHVVYGEVGGSHTVILSTTTSLVTTAFSDPGGSFPIENYKLSNAAGDYLRVNTSDTYHGHVDLSGGGSDLLVFNGNSATVAGDVDRHSTTLNFKGGATAAGGDVLQVQLATSISSGTAIIVTAMDTDVTAERTIIINSFAGAMMDETWSQADAQAAVGFAIDQIQAGTYTVAVYFAGGGQSGAYVMAMTTAADNPGAASYDLIGVLSSTAVNTLTGANFT